MESTETPPPLIGTPAEQLADALAQIAQLRAQLLSASRANTPSVTHHPRDYPVKLKDTDPLTDGTVPSFTNWKTSIEDKFIINASMFDLEVTKMAYIFNRTSEIAQKHLAPRYRKGPDPFTSAEQMIDYLAEILANPFESQDARAEYRLLTMRDDEPFAAFYTEFLRLIGTASIPTDDL